jgi:hypothetical protein
MIEAALLVKQKNCLSKLTSKDTSWEETLTERGRYALICELLKLPEVVERDAAVKQRGHNAR